MPTNRPSALNRLLLCWALPGAVLGLAGCASSSSAPPPPVGAPTDTSPVAEAAADDGATPDVAVSGATDTSVAANTRAPGAPPSPQVRRDVLEGVRIINSNPDRARALFQAAADADPTFAAAHYNAGVAAERLGDFSAAARSYQAAANANPKYFAAIENLANLSIRQGQPGQAESVLLRAIKANPSDLGLRNRLTSVWIASRQRTKQAEAEAKKVLKVDERNVGALLNLADDLSTVEANTSWRRLC